MQYDDLIQPLQNNIKTMFAFIGSIQNDNILYRKENECLSVYDYIWHLSITQEIFFKRLEAFIEQSDTKILPIAINEPAVNTRADLTKISYLMRAYEDWRLRQIALLRLAQDEIWDKKAADDGFEDYSFKQCVKDILLNDSLHMEQIGALIFLEDTSGWTRPAKGESR